MALRGRVAAALLAGAAALALVLLTVPAPAAASSTTVTVLAGTATVTNDFGSRAAADGELVRPGDEIRTSSDGHAVLTFLDGSTIVIEPGAALVLEEATFRQGSVAVRVFQSVGLTWSSVSRLLAPGSRFEVRTPAATASVRGTAFEVEVAPDGATRVRTSEGTVAVANGQGEVILGEGAETTAEPDEAPAPPSAPPPSTRRTLEIGERAVLIVDALGRACGKDDDRVVQQIPGCTVRDGQIQIENVERAGDYRIAVVVDPGQDTTVVERTVATSGETIREVALPATVATAAPVVSSARPTIEVNLPLGIGPIPVQLDLATAMPVDRGGAASATPGSFAGPRIELPTLPFGQATEAPTTAPAVAPTATPRLPLPTVSIPPVVKTLAPTVVPTAVPTLVPTAVPTIAPTLPIRIATATPAPTPEPTPEPTPDPTPEPTPIISITPLPTVGLQLTPTPTPTPSPSPTPTQAPTATPAPSTAAPSPTPTCGVLGRNPLTGQCL